MTKGNNTMTETVGEFLARNGAINEVEAGVTKADPNATWQDSNQVSWRKKEAGENKPAENLIKEQGV
jgi:hypothetical protein